MENWSDHDFLSDLPLHIIHSILALVPIQDAVRTCILSKEWRYKWATLPHLVFSNRLASLPHLIFGNRYLKNFVTNALLLHKGPILKFELRALSLNHCSDTDRWLLLLSRKEIRQFCLTIHPEPDLFLLHSSLYSCRKLTRLELSYCELPTLPQNFEGFPCLTSLFLRFVVLPPSTGVQSLVSHSPLLKRFLYQCTEISELRISAPNLWCVEVEGDFREIVVCAPLMTAALVLLSDDAFAAEQLLQNSSVCHYTKLLESFPNLQILAGNGFFIKYLSIGFESYDFSLTFHRLMIIKLIRVNFHDVKEISVIVRLTMDAPNLQELHLWACLDAQDPPISNFSDFGCAPNFTFNKLRVIKISGICGLSSEMKLIELLLRHSTVLETMTLSYSRHLVPEKILMCELLRYRRASPNAEILLS